MTSNGFSFGLAAMTGLLLGLGACTPGLPLVDTDGDTDTDTDTDTDGSAGTTADTADATTSTSTTDPVTSASTTSGTTVSSASDTSTDTDPGCPPGEAGCLCEVGSTCEGDLECVEGTCVDPGAACTDSDDEPNGSLEEATDLQSVECGGDPGEAMGVVAGVDVDVYTFGRTIGFCVGEDPDVEVTADNDLDVCVYVDCPGDAMGTVTCADGEAGEMNSMPGCCGQNRARFEDFGCGIGVIADPSHVIVVGPATAGACVEYELSYRLN